MIAYSIRGASADTGLGRDLISAAIAAGDLIVHYRPGTNRPLILDDDLRAWIRTFPTARAS